MIPAPVAEYGRPGPSNGQIRTALHARGSRTVVTEKECAEPLYFQRLLYRDGLAQMIMMSSAGGILQGDSYRIDITMGEGASARITSQGANRIYGMERGVAVQETSIQLGEGAYLEFFAGQIIPYANSRYFQNTRCTVHPRAVLAYAEVVSPGRVARGEMYDYDILYLKTAICQPAGRLIAADVSCIQPKSSPCTATGILGEYSVWGSVHVVAACHLQAVLEAVADVGNTGGAITGHSIMAYDSGVLVRILASRADAVCDVVEQILAAIREAVPCGSPYHGHRL